MKAKIKNITIDSQALTPTLTVKVDLEFGNNVEAPVSVSGRLLSSDGKVISNLNEYQIFSDNSYEVNILTQAEKDKLYQENNVSYYSSQLTAPLSPKAVEHIEIQREKDQEKSVKFLLDLVVKFIDIPAEPQNIATDGLIRLQVKRANSDFVIKQSDWVRNYSPLLGIGNFLLLELQIPEDRKVTEFWKDFYTNLSNNLKEIEKCIRSGDWQKAMFFARKFYANSKIGDNKVGHEKFREEFNELMMKDQHSQEGIDDLYNAIWKLFEFISKYTHDDDRKGNFNSMPVATKEDAYFAYVIALGFLNLIGRKANAE